jgi:hypothetical protein
METRARGETLLARRGAANEEVLLAPSHVRRTEPSAGGAACVLKARQAFNRPSLPGCRLERVTRSTAEDRNCKNEKTGLTF